MINKIGILGFSPSAFLHDLDAFLCVVVMVLDVRVVIASAGVWPLEFFYPHSG